MPVQTDPWPAGSPSWVDLAVPDIAAARQFYGAVLGWEFADSGPEYGGYVTCSRNGATTAGLSPLFAPGMPVAWTLYIASDDAAATAAAVADAGGTVAFGPIDVMGQGTMAVAADPTGAAFGIWQAGTNPGYRLHSEPGGLVWEHAVVPDSSVAREFYTRVFDWSYGELGNDQYTFAVGDRPLGGLGGTGNSSGETTHTGWALWFGVADCDEAARVAAHHGGKVVGVPEDTPFGRQARLMDPAGAEFFVMAVPAP